MSKLTYLKPCVEVLDIVAETAMVPLSTGLGENEFEGLPGPDKTKVANYTFEQRNRSCSWGDDLGY